MFPAFPRFDDCLPADFFDKTKPHIRNRSRPIQPAFLLHLADNMFQRLFFIRVQIQTRLNLLIAFCQLRCSKAHRNTRILRVIFDQMHNAMQAAVHRTTVIIRITEILPSRLLLKMRHMKRMIDQLSDSFILCRRDRDNRNSQFFLQFVDADRTAVLAHLVHHIKRQNHRNIQFQKLHGQIQVALNVRRIHDIDDSLRVLLQNKLTRHQLLIRIWR